MSGSDPMASDAVALSRAIHSRQVSCEEAMRASLDAIARLNPRFVAVVSLRPEEALMTEARARDAELAAGRPRGWLHGIPFAVKDLAEAAGLPWTEGSPLFARRVAKRDAPFVARIRTAGAVVIGKTNTPEFGLGSQTHNPVFGTTRNAWDPALTAGGSSGGAAVALALRMVAVADGSDHAGSLRNPAGWNGVLGLRPTLGRVVDARGDPFSAGLAVAGPMARSVEDLAALLDTMAGPDPRAPLSLPAEALREVPLSDPRGLRIGWLADLGGRLPTEPGVLEACEEALRVLEGLGCAVEPAALGFPPERIWEAWLTLRQVTVGARLRPLWDDPAARARLKPEARWEVERGLRLTAAEVGRGRGGARRVARGDPGALRAVRRARPADGAGPRVRRGGPLAPVDRGPTDGQLPPLDGGRDRAHHGRRPGPGDARPGRGADGGAALGALGLGATAPVARGRLRGGDGLRRAPSAGRAVRLAREGTTGRSAASTREAGGAVRGDGTAPHGPSGDHDRRGRRGAAPPAGAVGDRRTAARSGSALGRSADGPRPPTGAAAGALTRPAGPRRGPRGPGGSRRGR